MNALFNSRSFCETLVQDEREEGNRPTRCGTLVIANSTVRLGTMHPFQKEGILLLLTVPFQKEQGASSVRTGRGAFLFPF